MALQRETKMIGRSEMYRLGVGSTISLQLKKSQPSGHSSSSPTEHATEEVESGLLNPSPFISTSSFSRIKSWQALCFLYCHEYVWGPEIYRRVSDNAISSPAFCALPEGRRGGGPDMKCARAEPDLEPPAAAAVPAVPLAPFCCCEPRAICNSCEQSEAASA
jgi:hypothetical protein